MYSWLSNISTWLLIEIIATILLILLNLIVPILMIFSSYRNLINFYFSSTAISSALIDCLYLFYLIQTIRLKKLSEINCRAFYYLQTSCIVTLAYTIVAMHVNFTLSFIFSSNSSDQHRFIHRCFHYLRRIFRRIFFGFVLCIWSLSFTSTVPLLYTIDSNEKSPKPVYCPGTKEISYLEEWFDQNRFIQTILFNLIPLIICIFLSLIIFFKLIFDCLNYFYIRWKQSQCCPCRKQINSSSNIIIIQTYRKCFIHSFLHFLLILSLSLLACIYPIVMRFYLIYFSVFVPLIFAGFNYSLNYIQTTTGTSTIVENQMIDENPVVLNRITLNNEIINRPVQIQSPIMMNLLNRQDQQPSSPSPSSTSTVLSTPRQIHQRQKKYQRNSFINHFYENIRNIYTK